MTRSSFVKPDTFGINGNVLNYEWAAAHRAALRESAVRRGIFVERHPPNEKAPQVRQVGRLPRPGDVAPTALGINDEILLGVQLL